MVIIWQQANSTAIDLLTFQSIASATDLLTFQSVP